MQLLALFDLDNTLIDRQGALAEWARAFSVRLTLSPDAERLVISTLCDRAYPADFERLRTSLGLAASVESLWAEYVDGMASLARCPDGLHSELSGMREAGWTLGVVTNRPADIQLAKLKSAGLSGLIDGVCASEEVGVRKPSAVLFQTAAARCGITLAGGGRMVGDNPATDIAGGRAAGLRTLWIASGRQWPEGKGSPDAVAVDTLEAIQHLMDWGRSPGQLSRAE